MLVLTRKKNESIVIDGRITVTVVDVIDGRKVRLGISAPLDVVVDREEVDAIKRERGYKP